MTREKFILFWALIFVTSSVVLVIVARHATLGIGILAGIVFYGLCLASLVFGTTPKPRPCHCCTHCPNAPSGCCGPSVDGSPVPCCLCHHSG